MKRYFRSCLLLLTMVMLGTHIQAYDKRSETTRHLSAVTKINGYYCKGWITTTTDGKLVSFDSAAPIRVRGGVIPTGSRIVLFSNLKVQSVCLFKPTIIQGMPCIGYGPESPAMTFYPNGTLRTFYVSHQTRIQGFLCHSGTFSRIILSPEGKLLSCELAEDKVVDGQQIKARSIIYLDDKGRLTKVRKSNRFRSLFFDTLDKII